MAHIYIIMAEVLVCHKNDRQNEPRFLVHFVTDKSRIYLRVFFSTLPFQRAMSHLYFARV